MTSNKWLSRKPVSLRLTMCARFAVFAFFLVLDVQAQDQASFLRSSDARCQYTFAVDKPVESSCPGTMEAENLNARITLLEAALSSLLGAEAGTETVRTPAETGEMRQLVQDRDLLSRRVKELQRRVEELTMETEKLRKEPCPLVPDSEDSFGVHRASGCGELFSVGKPETHQKSDSITGKYGMWFQDPESPGAPYGPDTVWRIDTVSNDVRELYAYENLDQFARGYPTKVLLLPESMESTGATVYQGSLYYQRKQSPMLLRYDLTAEKVMVRRELPHAGFHGQFPYSWGGYTDVDLAVDENGLWAIYSTEKARGAIVVSQLDPENLEVTRSWETSIQKNKVANAFMVCGRLYTVASYRANRTTINFSFDTASGQSKAVNIRFHNRYGYNSMIDYNAARRKLYSWDNFHMVTYDVELTGSSSSH